MRRDPKALVLGLAACALLVGCAPRVHVTPLGEPAGRSRLATPDGMALYSTRVPECPYEELALITAYADELLGDLDDALAALKEEAWAMGADALVGLRTVTSGGEDPDEGYAATAVRFERDDCTR